MLEEASLMMASLSHFLTFFNLYTPVSPQFVHFTYKKMTIRAQFHKIKENDGRAARKTAIRVVLWFVASQVVCVVVYFVFRVEEGPPHVWQIGRIRSREQTSVLGAERAVLEARYFLTSLSVPSGALSLSNSHESYHGVTGSFCPLDWHLQKSNPSTVAMFRDLIAASHHCKQHAITLDISHISKEARHFDQFSQGAPHELQIGGLVFHETRCGSTLTANLLSAADPPAHRVYSEASPLLTSILACNYSLDCSQQKQDDLIRDVLYLMGRSSDIREKRVFYKIQSVGVRNIATLSRVIPNVPWIFIYRNPVEVIMSHFKNASITNKAVCLRGRSTPHPLITEIAQQHGREPKSLTNAEYCAAHLASLCQAAMQQFDDTHHGRFVNYADLPDILWNDIFVNYFQIPQHSLHHKEMLKAANVYSKGRGTRANQEWQQDSAHKQEHTTPEIQQAAQEFLQPVFEKLETLSHLQRT